MLRNLCSLTPALSQRERGKSKVETCNTCGAELNGNSLKLRRRYWYFRRPGEGRDPVALAGAAADLEKGVHAAKWWFDFEQPALPHPGHLPKGEGEKQGGNMRYLRRSFTRFPRNAQPFPNQRAA
jgi:hypothetical protein